MQYLRNVRFTSFLVIGFFVSLAVLGQENLKHRLLHGYLLSTDAPVVKGKPTLFVFELADTFGEVFKAASSQSKQPDAINFEKEMVIGVALPATNKPPKLSISRVFVQDSTLTVRYIRMTDSAVVKSPLATPIQPTLLIAIPKQTVLKTRLIENGKVMQTLKKDI